MVVVVDGLAASGGYIAALSADHIVAQDTSLVGSIGVLFQYPNFTDVLKTIGVKVEEIKSSPLKAAPNGFEPTSPEARAAIEAIVLDSYAWFKNLVQDAPQLDDGQLGASRRRARLHRPAGASSSSSSTSSAMRKSRCAWLDKKKNVAANTPVRDCRCEPRFSDFHSCTSRRGASMRSA